MMMLKRHKLNLLMSEFFSYFLRIFRALNKNLSRLYYVYYNQTQYFIKCINIMLLWGCRAKENLFLYEEKKIVSRVQQRKLFIGGSKLLLLKAGLNERVTRLHSERFSNEAAKLRKPRRTLDEVSSRSEI